MNPVRNSKNPYFYLLKRLKSRRKKREISNGVKKTIFIFSFAIFLFSSLGVNAETLGEQRSFYVQKDYDLSQREEIQAKLVKVTSELYFYIDSEWWNSSSQNQVYSSLSVLDEEFKNTIYPVLTSTFGQEWKPGIDNDEKITILIHPMIAEAGGYFNSGNEYPNLQVTDSNEREMVYLNAEYIGNLQMKSYLAHEFVHLIAFNQKERMYGDSGEIWLNEARADYAPTLLGYDDVYVGSNLSRRVSGFLEKPSDSLTEWKSKDSDYGVANLFIQYLVDHYGVGILVDSLKSPKQGIDSINYALNNNGFNKDFSEVFTDWTIAVLVNDCKIGELYCYLNPGLKNLQINPLINFLPLSGKSTLSVSDVTKSWAGKWYKIIGGKGTLNIKFFGNSKTSFVIPYLTGNLTKDYTLNFLEMGQQKKAEINIKEFGSEIMFLIFIPSIQDKFSGFSDNEPSYSFSWSASIVETKEEIDEIKELVAQIEFLKKEITKLQAQINAILGKSASCEVFNQNLYYGLSNNNQVRCLQDFLKSQGDEVYPEGIVSGNFASLTLKAVINFQNKYASEILTPLGLEKATGFVGQSTRAKINQLLGK